jgi:hypothetical protein
MSTTTVVTLMGSFLSDQMATFGSILPSVLAALGILLVIGFAIHLIRKYVFKKKV